MRSVSRIITLLAVALVPALGSQVAGAADEPLFVNYGARALISEGDPNHGQVIYLSVPAGTTQRLYLRLFDPDTGGRLDQIVGRSPNTSTRFAVFGGPGAYAAAFAQPERLSREERTAGKLIAQRVFGSSLRYDNQWMTLTALEPAQGELVGDRFVFRLLVETVSGQDGNAFDVKLSLSDKENIAPEGQRMFSFVPVIRLPHRGPFVELRFRIPEDAVSLTFGNFDAAGGVVELTERFGGTYPLEASEQGVWRTSQFTVNPDLRDTEAAITLSGGVEQPNDVTYYISDGSKLVPIELPARLFDKTPDRPKAVALATEQSCTAIQFDGLRSSDPNGDRLNYRWRFGDDTFATGGNVVHDYQVEGRFVAWLEVTNTSPQVANGAAAPVRVFVKRPPVSLSEVKKLVAIREEVVFDGTMSTARDWVITQQQWRFSDGIVLTGEKALRAFETPGRYRVTHIVTDNSGHRCNTHSEEFEIRVNAPPIARAGSEQHVTASLVQFDGTRSSDADDEIIRYDWDFGDGTTGTGPRPTHVYAKPGTFEVRLTVKDVSGTLRDTGTDTVRIIINARPIADAGPDLVGVPGQKLVFQGNRSVDPDGRITEYFWDFRDGTTASGPVVEHAFAKPGTYGVRLRVRDNTGHEEAVDYDEMQAFINAPPVAVAGPDVLAAPGDEVKLSGAHSFDPDGKIASYRWNFSDVAEPVENVEATRRYEKSGIYTAQLTVIDDSGAANASGVAELRIRINHAPVAKAGENVETGELTVTFDGTKSVDADGDPLVYEWDFGDGQKATGARVTHTFKEGGTYPVVLTVDDGTKLANARASEAISVKIKRPPVAIAGENQRVCTGDTVVFDGSKSFDPEGGLLRYLWDFGDNTKSEIVNPTKAYRRGGVYPVTLMVKDDSGFPRNFHTARIAIRVDQGPVADAGPREILACAKTEVVFDGTKSTDIDGVVNSFLWDFGDGVFGGGARPLHIYDRPGRYRAFLTIQGEKVGNCSATSTDEIAVRIIEGPVAVIKAPEAVPITDEVAFDGSASRMTGGKITGWRWDFGDGRQATGAQVKHKYSAPGTYRVTLTITSDSDAPSCRAVSVRQLINVNAPPVAAAGGNKHVAAEDEVVFDASASRDPDGGIVAYEWDFGDGDKASGVIVRHKYRAPGSYKARLTVHDQAGLANSTATDEITVRVNAPPVPAIAGPEMVCVDERNTWRGDRSTDADGPIRSFHWVLGDGASVNTRDVTHAYKKPGSYSLTLYADDGAGLGNSQRHVTRSIRVNERPFAVAGAYPRVLPAQVILFDASKSGDGDGKITRYTWDFGDGTTADGVKVEHAYAQPGTYKVKLTVTDDSGSACASHSDTVEVVVNAQPVARAGKDIDTGELTVAFDATASSDANGDALTYQWDFGDGSKATGARVTHAYKDGGTYPVVLVVDDGTGLANARSSDAISVRINRPPLAVAGENRRVCTGDPIVFDASKSTDPEGGVLRYLWDFGDGNKSEIVNPTKTYRRGGMYPVTLTVRDNSGFPGNAHTARVTVRVDQGPIADAGPREILACAKTEVAFDGTKSTDIDGVVNSFLWDFGDGVFGAGEKTMHIYDKPGNYRTFLTIQGEKVGNCSAASTDEVRVRIIEGPVAVIKAPAAAPITDEITFDAAASYMTDGKITGWRWDFGDGSRATGAQVKHKYAAAGVYRVSLTITSDSTSPTCQQVSVRHVIVVNAPPVAAAGGDKLVAAEEDVVFDGSGSRDPDGGIIAYEWDLGDGNKASGVVVRHKYPEPGVYKVKLLVRDEADLPNSTVTDEVTVRVNAPPVPVITGPETVCVDERTTWRSAASRDPDGPIRAFRWIMGDGITAATADITHAYKKLGKFGLTLYADDGTRLANSERHVTRTVHVNQRPQAVAGLPSLVCSGDAVEFDGTKSSDPDGKITKYVWDFGDGSTAEGPKTKHAFAKPGTYKVKLTVTDDTPSICSSHTDTVEVTVNTPPVAIAGPDREVWIGGANDAVLLDATGSRHPDGRALSFAWQIGDSDAKLGERVRHTLATPGEYPVTLTVTDTTELSCGTATASFRIIARQRN